MHWRDKLSKQELQHIKEAGATTFEEVKRNALYQSQMIFPCWSCVEIGKKLGIEVELTAFKNHNKVEGGPSEA